MLEEYIYLVKLIKNIYTLPSHADQEYIYLISETSPSLRCKLLTEIIKPLQKYTNSNALRSITTTYKILL